MHRLAAGIVIGGCLALAASSGTAAEREVLPRPGTLLVNKNRGELLLTGVTQYPRGKPCIDEYGQRVQAFAGTGKAAGGDAKMAGYFVFLIDVSTEDIHAAMLQLGARPRTHYSMEEGKKHSGLKPETKTEDYLQGDPVILSVFWQDNGRWVERPYQDFVTERVLVDGKPVEKPWTPAFVYHGSGVLHRSGTGCIACPCDCAGGLIADNRNPLYDPKPLVCFHLNKAPREGARIYLRVRLIPTRGL